MKNEYEALGIPNSGYTYMRFREDNKSFEEIVETSVIEFEKLKNFLAEVVNSDTIPEFQGKNKKIQFINYGDTELVYVLSVDNRKYTLLVGQPRTKFGDVKKEYENLNILGKKYDENIVTPIYYKKNDELKKELYITPYVYQARGIGVENTEWGMWVPEPKYHFKEFSEEERKIINSSMIALLIKFFDERKKLGIGLCRVTGGDFILDKDFEKEEFSYENILKRMKLISAREFIPMTLEEYLKKIREEFVKRTYYKKDEERDDSILINNKARAPMSLEEIEKGIELGLQLREKDKQYER